MNGLLEWIWISSFYIFIAGSVLLFIRLIMKKMQCSQSSIYQLWLIFPLGLLGLSLMVFFNVDIEVMPEIKSFILPNLTTTYANEYSQQNQGISWSFVLSSLWVFSVLILLAKLTLKYRKLKNHLHSGRFIKNDNVYETHQISEPMAFGIFVPCVYLPYSQFESLSSNQCKLVMEHEQIHCLRYDPMVRMLYKIFEGLFWYHPLIYLINAVVKMDQESSVDELVLYNYTDSKIKSEYSQLLLHFSQSVNNKGRSIPGHYCPSISLLKERIMIIKNNPLNENKITRKIKGLLFIATAVSAVVVTASSLANNTQSIIANETNDLIPKPPLVVKAPKAPIAPKVPKANIKITPIKQAAPYYPRQAAIDKITGDVTMEFEISTSGFAENVRVIESNPPGVFDKEAISSVKRSQYAPIAQPITLQQNIEFKLDSPQ